MLRLEAGHLLLMQYKVIIAMRDHEPQEIPHEWLYQYMEVHEHLVAALAVNQLDDDAFYS